MWSRAHAGFLRPWALRGGRSGRRGVDRVLPGRHQPPGRGATGPEGCRGARARPGEAKGSSHTPPFCRPAPRVCSGTCTPSLHCPAEARRSAGLTCPGRGRCGLREGGARGWGAA